ncbi:hypothetical protein HUJ04_004741 [Dendroctonus ponderosae]|nr:hypothetical protein HUJ04_004741 [Dendroctonus ponderosae]
MYYPRTWQHFLMLSHSGELLEIDGSSIRHSVDYRLQFEYHLNNFSKICQLLQMFPLKEISLIFVILKRTLFENFQLTIPSYKLNTKSTVIPLPVGCYMIHVGWCGQSCSLSTHQLTDINAHHEAQAEIQGAPELYIRAGSLLRLVCTLKHSTEPPAFVFWFHEQRMINYDQGISVVESRSSSILHLQDADKSHNGNYTCSPSNAVPASINVHVLNATAELFEVFSSKTYITYHKPWIIIWNSDNSLVINT